MSTTLQDIETRLAELQAQLATAQAAHFNSAVQAAVDLFANARVPLDEAAAALLTLHNQSTCPKRAKVAPKYRPRLTGATWTGRGEQPKWFAAAEQSELEHLGGDLA